MEHIDSVCCCWLTIHCYSFLCISILLYYYYYLFILFYFVLFSLFPVMLYYSIHKRFRLSYCTAGIVTVCYFVCNLMAFVR